MSGTSKQTSDSSQNNIFRSVYNDTDASLTVSGFITGKVGYKITKTAVDSITDDLAFYDGTNLLYCLRIIYTATTKDDFSSIERIS